MSETVLVETHGDWMQITLNRPDKLNCLNKSMHLALRAALQQAHDQAARAVLIPELGGGFVRVRILATGALVHLTGRLICNKL